MDLSYIASLRKFVSDSSVRERYLEICYNWFGKLFGFAETFEESADLIEKRGLRGPEAIRFLDQMLFDNATLVGRICRE